MQHIIRSELYRMRKNKSTWVILIILLILMFIVAISDGFVFGNAPWVKEMMGNLSAAVSAGMGDFSFNELFAMLGLMNCKSIAEFITYSMRRMDIIFFIAVFITCFTVPKRHTGFVKSTAGMYPNHWFSFSDILMILLFSFLIEFVTALSSLSAAFICFEDTPFGDPVSFAVYFVLHVLLVFVSGVAMNCVTQIFKGGFGVVLIIGFSVMFSSIVYSAADTILGALTGSDLRIEALTPVGNITDLEYNNWNQYFRAMLVIVAYGLMGICSEFFIFAKKDRV